MIPPLHISEIFKSKSKAFFGATLLVLGCAKNSGDSIQPPVPSNDTKAASALPADGELRSYEKCTSHEMADGRHMIWIDAHRALDGQTIPAHCYFPPIVETFSDEDAFRIPDNAGAGVPDSEKAGVPWKFGPSK